MIDVKTFITSHAEDVMAMIQQHIDAYIQSRMGAIVQATLMSYLAASANPKTAVEFRLFNHQMMQLETAGLKTIWASIKDDVAVQKGYSPRSMFVRYYSHSNR